jgi:hypothetical protein
MQTWKWENEQLFIINRELQQLLDDKIVKTVVSMSLVATEDPKSSLSFYSAILIYK